MNLRSLDWKFFLALFVSLLGLVVPLLWQADLSSKSLELKLRSSTSLEPSAQIRNLELVLDGKKLNSPYSSSLELTNTGSKPIRMKDFDTPIEISLGEGAQIVTARVVSSSPEDIPVIVSSTERSVTVAPYLSNSGDTISLNVITSGKRPAYSVRGRIAELQQITYTDLTVPKSPYLRYLKPVASGIAAWLLFSLNVMCLVAFIQRKDLAVPGIFGLFGWLATNAGGVPLLIYMADGLDVINRYGLLLVVLIVFAIGSSFVVDPVMRRWLHLVKSNAARAGFNSGMTLARERHRGERIQ